MNIISLVLWLVLAFTWFYESIQNIKLDSRCNFFLAGLKLNKYVNYTLIYKNIYSKIYIYNESVILVIPYKLYEDSVFNLKLIRIIKNN